MSKIPSSVRVCNLQPPQHATRAARYVYGGYLEGYHCDGGGGSATSGERRWGLMGVDPARAGRGFCRNGVGTSSELWRLDPVTLVWTLLHTAGDPTPSVTPPSRERHSAVVMGRRKGLYGGWMLVFGGHSGGKGVRFACVGRRGLFVCGCALRIAYAYV